MKQLLNYLEAIDPVTVYIIYSPTAATEPVFPVKGYAGPSGRIDEIARTMLAAIHEDSLTLSILMGPPSPPKCLLYTPSWGRIVSERQAVEDIRRAMMGKPSTMVKLIECDFHSSINTLYRAGYTIVLLDEKGQDIAKVNSIGNKHALAMGAQVDIPQQELERVKRYIRFRISISPLSYQAHQVVTFLEWFKSLKRVNV